MSASHNHSHSHSHKPSAAVVVGTLLQGKEAELSHELDYIRHAVQEVNVVSKHDLQKLLCNKTCTLMAQLLGGLMAYVARGLAAPQASPPMHVSLLPSSNPHARHAFIPCHAFQVVHASTGVVAGMHVRCNVHHVAVALPACGLTVSTVLPSMHPHGSNTAPHWTSAWSERAMHPRRALHCWIREACLWYMYAQQP
jgi:hypothetical protein